MQLERKHLAESTICGDDEVELSNLAAGERHRDLPATWIVGHRFDFAAAFWWRALERLQQGPVQIASIERRGRVLASGAEGEAPHDSAGQAVDKGGQFMSAPSPEFSSACSRPIWASAYFPFAWTLSWYPVERGADDCSRMSIDIPIRRRACAIEIPATPAPMTAPCMAPVIFRCSTAKGRHVGLIRAWWTG